MELIIAGAAGVLAVIILIMGIISIRSERQEAIEDRLGRYTSEYGSLMTDFEEYQVQPDEPSILTQRLDKALADREFARKWRVQLARADLKLTVAEYFSLHIITAIGMAVVGTFV